MEQKIKYFAFGSNMHLARMRDRVPSSEFIAIGTLDNFSLKFHKRSPDGSAKCSISPDTRGIHPVLGVIYRMKSTEKNYLDSCEDVGNGYEVKQLEVLDGKKNHSVFTYCAQEPWIDDNILPYDWYKSLVIEGAKYFDFPKYYIANLKIQDTWLDQNRERVKEHQRILDKL